MHSRLSAHSDTNSGLEQMSLLSNMTMSMIASPSLSDIPLSLMNEYDRLSQHFFQYTLLFWSYLQMLITKLDNSQILDFFLTYFLLTFFMARECKLYSYLLTTDR